jgi:hypothetical protein
MSDGSGRSPMRRYLLEGGLAILLLSASIVVGYTFLVTASTQAKAGAQAQPVVATTPPAPGLRPSASPDDTAIPTAVPATPSPAVAPAPSVPAAPAPAADESATRPWPVTISGRVVDTRREPVGGVSVTVGGREFRTGDDGTFTVTGAPAGATLVVKQPGYDKVVVRPTDTRIEAVLRPHAIKAAYLTYYGFVDRSIRNRVLDLVTKTELNAVVIDVKGDRGWVLYRSQVPLAVAIGAQGPATVKDFDAMMADLKGRGIYTIARIVTFKDNILANARPDLAVMDTRTGKPWIDRERLAWVDPFREEVWDYNIALAQEAVRKGFDEVQFDYVRFPTDGKLSAARYSKSVTKDSRLPTIAAFLGRARKEIGPLGAFVAADIFGYTAFNENDTDIGQRVEELAPQVDYLSPMVYPSGYHLGIPRYRNPVAHPYEVVHESVRLIKKRANGHPVKVRPWLQDFRDYAFGRKVFGVGEVRAQIKGSDDAGGSGWMLWNPRNDYTGAALKPKASVAAR